MRPFLPGGGFFTAIRWGGGRSWPLAAPEAQDLGHSSLPSCEKPKFFKKYCRGQCDIKSTLGTLEISALFKAPFSTHFLSPTSV